MNSRLNASAVRNPLIEYGAQVTRHVGRVLPGAGVIAWVSAVPAALTAAKPGHVYIIDKIRLSGSNTSASAAAIVGIQIRNAAGSVVGTMHFNVSGRQKRDYPSRIDEVYEFNGSLVIPSGHYLTAVPVGGGSSLLVLPEVHGGYLSATQAAQSGLNVGDTTTAGNFWMTFYSPDQNRTDVELVAARAGKSIEIHGAIMTGQPSESTVTANIMHKMTHGSLGAVSRTVFSFSAKNAGTQTISSGSADAAVTTTATTLADTRVSWITDEHIGRTVTADGKTGLIVSNTATVLTVNAWAGGTPATNSAWTVTEELGSRPFQQVLCGIERNLPIGASMTLDCTVTTTGRNDASRTSLVLWGRYTDNPDTFNPYGLPDIWGTVSTGSTDDITFSDATRLWEVDKYIGLTVKMTSGECSGQERTVESNTATQITVTEAWDGEIAEDDTFEFVVPKGSKWWCARGGIACTVTNERAFSMVPPIMSAFSEMTEFCAQGVPVDASLPTMACIVPAVGTRAAGVSALTAITINTGVYFPATSLPVNVVLSPGSVTSAVENFCTSIDQTSVVAQIGLDAHLLTVVSNGWANANFSAGGRLHHDAKYTTSIATRYTP